MKNENKREIAKEIRNAKTIGLITHKDGDGDAFGSMIGLSRGLKALGKKPVIFSNEKVNGILAFLSGKIDYHPRRTYLPIDLLICLDGSSTKRFTIPEIVLSAKEKNVPIVVIDHHLPGDIKDVASVYWRADEESCTSEMVFDLLNYMDIKIDKVTASVILLGIETDTVSLQFTNTKPKTYETVADLLRKGARLKPVVESAFGGKPIPAIKLLGRTLDRMTLGTKTGILKTYVTKKDVKELELETEASSGVANFIEQVEGAKLVVVFEERPDNMVKVSLRSNNSNADVEKVAKFFGGGGHKKASGFEREGKLEDVMKTVINELKKRYEEGKWE